MLYLSRPNTTVVVLSHSLADQMTIIGNEMRVQTSRLTNVWSQIKQLQVSNFHPLEIVGRGSETQFQVGEK